MNIDHIGYAVKNIERAMKSFEQLGFLFEEIFRDEHRNLYIVFGEKDGYRIELVCPMDKEKYSPVDTLLVKAGPTPYHICYGSEDIEKDIKILEAQGFRTIIPLEPAIAFGGKRVVFMMNLGLGMIEIVESKHE